MILNRNSRNLEVWFVLKEHHLTELLLQQVKKRKIAINGKVRWQRKKAKPKLISLSELNPKL